MFVVKDNDEKLIIKPNSNDSITVDNVKQSAGVYIDTGSGTSIGAGDYVCVIAVEADNWVVTGSGGTGKGVTSKSYCTACPDSSKGANILCEDFQVKDAMDVADGQL